MSASTLLRWAARQPPGRRLTLLCAENPASRAGEGPVRLDRCLTEVGLALPVELLAAGIAAVGVQTDGCHERAALDARVASWGALTATLERPDALAAVPADPAGASIVESRDLPVVRRRGLLGLGPAAAASRTGYVPDETATDSARLRAAARHLADAGLPGHQGVGLQLEAAGCTACGVCVRTCPEDALELSVTHGRARLAYRPSRCSGCGDCLVACEPGALSAPDERHHWSRLWEDGVQSLADFATERCSRCQHQYAPQDGQGLCPACSFRRAQPFGTALSAEAIARLAQRRPPVDREHPREEKHG